MFESKLIAVSYKYFRLTSSQATMGQGILSTKWNGTEVVTFLTFHHHLIIYTVLVTVSTDSSDDELNKSTWLADELENGFDEDTILADEDDDQPSGGNSL